MKRYQMDRMAAELTGAIARTLLDARPKLQKPLQSLVIYRDAFESFLPSELLLEWEEPVPPMGHESANLILPAPMIDTPVPFSAFEVEERPDELLADFARRNGIDSLGWHGQTSIPVTVVRAELARAYLTLPGRLRDGGLALAPTFKVWDGSPDDIEEFPDAATADRQVAKGLREKLKGAAAVRDFAALCFDSEERQHWLIRLATAS